MNHFQRSAVNTALRLNPSVVAASQEDFTAVHEAASHPDFIGLAWAEHHLGPSAHVVEAYLQAIRDGYLRYGPNAGDPDLLAALADKVRAENAIDAVADANVQITHGAGQALAMAFQAVLSPGDEVIGFDPSFPLNWGLATLNGVRLVTVPVAMDAVALGAALDVAVTERTRAVVMHNPNNPTGHVLTRPELETIALFAYRHNLVVISDEVYEQFVYDGREHVSIASLDGMLDRTVTIFGVSKEYGLAGLRVGYAVGGADLVAALRTIQHNSNVGANSAAQRAVLAAITGPQTEMRSWISRFGEARRRVVEVLDAVSTLSCPLPEGGMFAMVQLLDGGDGDAFSADLLRDQHVAVSPGSWYGPTMHPWFRVCYPGVPEADLRVALDRIVDFCAARRGTA